jgi:hypothetical protein
MTSNLSWTSFKKFFQLAIKLHAFRPFSYNSSTKNLKLNLDRKTLTCLFISNLNVIIQCIIIPILFTLQYIYIDPQKYIPVPLRNKVFFVLYFCTGIQTLVPLINILRLGHNYVEAFNCVVKIETVLKGNKDFKISF